MKKQLTNLKRYIQLLACLLTLPMLMSGCNQEDNVFEIFDSGVWNFVNYYKNVDWSSNNDRGAQPVYTELNDLNTLSQFTIIFDADGTFSGKLSGGGTYSGSWEADAKDRSFSVVGDIKTNVSLTGKNGEFIRALKASKFYRGDSKMMLRLAPEKRTNCMQFTHRK